MDGEQWVFRGDRRPRFAEVPGDGQESVWDYPRPPCIVADDRQVRVYSPTGLIADTRAARRVCETASPPTYYVPITDVVSTSLVEISGSSYCEWKGAARYFALGADVTRTPVAWDYPQPQPAYAALKEHIAFYPGRVACFVPGNRVMPQPGQFYGGWVTPDIIGPFKGEPGTEAW